MVDGVDYSVVVFLLFSLPWRYSWLTICVVVWLCIGGALGWYLISFAC